MLFEVQDPPKPSEPKSQNFHFICGADDYLVSREGKKLFDLHTKDISDDLSKETIDGLAQNVAEVESITNRFISAIQTISLFGDNKVVWLKSINFLADSVTGRSDASKAQVERLIHSLQSVDPSNTTVIITASPIDRRTKNFKLLQKNSNFTFIETSSNNDSLKSVASQEAKSLNITLPPPSLELLIEKVNGSTRLLIQEIQKLATYIGSEKSTIDENLIHQLVPQFGDGDFFEVTEAFFSLNLQWTLDALQRHFFTQKESRPIISSLQNRNRILIQLRTLIDSGDLRVSSRGIDKAALASLANTHNFPTDPKSKSSFNLFTQNPWYLGKLAESAKKAPLKRLIDFQEAFLEAFQGILDHPTEQYSVMQRLAFNCLS